jgi:hypothetical protein
MNVGLSRQTATARCCPGTSLGMRAPLPKLRAALESGNVKHALEGLSNNPDSLFSRRLAYPPPPAASSARDVLDSS